MKLLRRRIRALQQRAINELKMAYCGLDGKPLRTRTERPRAVLIKWRSRVLRRRTRQAALDKPRVHDGQLGFAIPEQKACVTAENRAFEEKQPLVFFCRKPRIHGFTVE